jgi:hypothetical protein
MSVNSVVFSSEEVREVYHYCSAVVRVVQPSSVMRSFAIASCRRALCSLPQRSHTAAAGFSTTATPARSGSAAVCRLNPATRTPASEAQLPTPARVATRMLIDGKMVSRASDGGSFSSIAPATGKVIQGAEAVPQASVQDVDAAVQAAHRAFHKRGEGSWASLTPRARGALLFKLSELM